eukprot:s3212_g6.t1
MNSLQYAEFGEINGISPKGHFGSMAADTGITYQAFANDFGHNLSKKNVAKEVIADLYVKTPAFVWIAPHVKGALVREGHASHISPMQWRNHLRAQRRCKDVAWELAHGACAQMDGGRHFAWEWPMDLKYGHDCEATRLIFDRGRALGIDLYDFVVHGCAYHQAPDVHGKKWRIITSSPSLATSLKGRRCPGHKEHPETPGGRVDLPSRMCADVLEGVLWELRGQGRALREDVEAWAAGDDFEGETAYAMGGPTAFPTEQPTGRRLQQIKEMMIRVHKASGHTSMESLSRLLLRRGAPEWAVSLAKTLSCPDCAEARRKTGPPHASVDEPAALWEVLGLDVFEYEHVVDPQPVKSKFLVMVDRGSRFTMVAFLKTYRSEENWEPTTQDIKSAVVRVWLNANPSPKWFFTDSAAYFTSREMIEFCSHSGVGLLVAPAEAHWLMGVEERTIQVLKRTVEKLEREDLDLTVSSMFVLAAHAHNSRVHHTTGYSPFQWARGWSRDNALPIGLDPKKAFGRSLLLRTKAEEAFLKADAAVKLSRLKNTVVRAAKEYRPGSLAMLWRARVRHGHGGWTGPLRVLLQEGSTVWLATGATLVRAKLNQLRPCTEREQLVVSTQGATIHQTAVGLDTLLKGYRGKHFLDASGETPGDELEENLEPAEVRVEPPAPEQRADRDVWEQRPGMLVRVHNVMRLSLFSPLKMKDLPEEHASAAPYSTSEDSDSSDELLPEGSDSKKQRIHYKKASEEAAFLGFAREIVISTKDLKKLTKKPRKAAVWLSQKMAEKSKEVNWRHLTLEEKKEYDEAQAVEVSNVVREAAVRSLTAEELCHLEWDKVMSMRWVLTRKSDGRAKARLVVLGYQAHNLTDVETAAPTLSRTSRNALLTVAANNKFILESGDITSAFLQSLSNLDSENLMVFAPSELSAMFGGDPAEPGSVLKLQKAFYGLVHAPRVWYESVRTALVEYGWRQMTFDRCLFGLYNSNNELIAVTGIHVDDFLIAGRKDDPSYEKAKEHLRSTFKFGKWSLATEGFTFAGCFVKQTAEGIYLNQEEYIREWVKEIPLSKERLRQLKSPATKEEIAALRGALGTVSWKADGAAAPRETLGSNGAEVQAVTVGEDSCFLLRAVWYELNGGTVSRESLEPSLQADTQGALVTDSKGIFDAMTRNLSSLHGLRSSRAGFELTVSYQQAIRLGTKLRWVNGVAQLADGLTKSNPSARKGLLEFLTKGQRWSIVYDPFFTAGKKLSKAKLQQMLKSQEEAFIIRLKAFTHEAHYPWYEEVLNATIGKEALSRVPASKEDVETQTDSVSETTASSSSAEAVAAIFRQHVVDTQGLLEDEMTNVNTVLDVQDEVLHALRKVTEDRTDLRARLKIKQSETDQVRRDLENAEAQVAATTEELRASEEKAVKSLPVRAIPALDAQEQQKMSDCVVGAEAIQSLQAELRVSHAAAAVLQSQVDELQSQVEAKQKELAALGKTLQDSEAKATDAATQLLTAQLKATSEEREALESQLHSVQEALQVHESQSKDLQSQLEAARVQQAEASSELEAKKQELEAEMSELLSVAQTLQAFNDDLQQQLQRAQAALQAFQRRSNSVVAAEATQSLQAAAAVLQSQVDELQSQVEAKQKELAALGKTLQASHCYHYLLKDESAQAAQACFDISTPRSSESPEAAQVAVAEAEHSGLLAENKLLRERLSASEEEKATSLQSLREQVMLLARENYDLKHGVRQAKAASPEAKEHRLSHGLSREVPAGSGAASEGDQRWWQCRLELGDTSGAQLKMKLSAIFSPFLTERDMREIHAQSRLDEADGRNEG